MKGINQMEAKRILTSYEKEIYHAQYNGLQKVLNHMATYYMENEPSTKHERLFEIDRQKQSVYELLMFNDIQPKLQKSTILEMDNYEIYKEYHTENEIEQISVSSYSIQAFEYAKELLHPTYLLMHSLSNEIAEYMETKPETRTQSIDEKMEALTMLIQAIEFYLPFRNSIQSTESYWNYIELPYSQYIPSNQIAFHQYAE